MSAIMQADAVQTMSSREIADLCEARHNDVVASIVRLFDREVLRESRKTTRTVAPEGGGRPMQVYDLTKRDTLVVVSGYNAELRAKIIDRWQELEAQTQSDPMVALNDPATMRGLLLSYSEKVMALETANAELAPKAEALDRIASAQGSLCITDAAKALQMPPRELFNWMQKSRWIFRRHGTGWIGYSDKTRGGYLEHKVTTIQRADGTDRVSEQVRVTPLGLTRIGELLQKQAVAA